MVLISESIPCFSSPLRLFLRLLLDGMEDANE
jgi:hypothetical protein